MLKSSALRHAATSILLLSLACTSLAQQGNWPQWRGPDRNGISPDKGLLKKWPDVGPSLLWKSTGLGSGYSTVSIANGRIFTSGDKADVNYVVCLKEEDGSSVWSAKLGKSGAPGWGGFAGPRATPTVDGDHVYAVDQWGELVCLESGTGKELWRKDYGKDFSAPRPEWGFSESPLVDGEHLIITPGGPKGTVAALDKKTGAVVWQTSSLTDPAHYSSIIKAQIAGVPQYVQLTANTLVGISLKDGQILWRTERKGKTAVIPDPVVFQDHVYVTSGYGVGCDLFKVTQSDGKFSVTPVYRDNKNMENHHGGVVLVDGHVYGYADRKGWTCQDVLTGEAKWVDKSLGKGSLVYADGMLVLRQEDKAGTVALVEASTAAYKELSRFNQPERSSKNSWPHPVISAGKLYLRDQDNLLCFSVAK